MRQLLFGFEVAAFHSGCPCRAVGVLRQRTPCQQKVDSLRSAQRTDLTVAFLGNTAQLQHIRRHKDPPAVTGELPQCPDRRPHGIGTGIVAVLHHGNALMLRHLLTLPAGGVVFQSLYGGLGGNPHCASRAECRQRIQYEMLAGTGNGRAPALSLGVQHKVGGKRRCADNGRFDLRTLAVQPIADYMKPRDINGLQKVVIITQQQRGAVRQGVRQLQLGF